ncbi:hypothetical protein CEXT_810721 [Caerostris extrusa]|uniref:Ribosomal protein S10 n=1 Tax=Caerostris extrusa TaxID=172846 RepID=A0AAV4QKA6_CAEEX|nr:hypothetical protein CEXT_810721 [Caerostris extrusa]
MVTCIKRRRTLVWESRFCLFQPVTSTNLNISGETSFVPLEVGGGSRVGGRRVPFPPKKLIFDGFNNRAKSSLVYLNQYLPYSSNAFPTTPERQIPPSQTLERNSNYPTFFLFKMFSRVLNINLYFPPSLVSCAFREFARKGILTTNDPFLCSTPAKPLAQRYRRRTSHCSLIIRDSSLGELITEQLEHPRVCLPTPRPFKVTSSPRSSGGGSVGEGPSV